MSVGEECLHEAARVVDEWQDYNDGNTYSAFECDDCGYRFVLTS